MKGELWVCPFRTCTEEQAQLCRVHLKGCIDAIPDTRLAIAMAALQSISEYWRYALKKMTDACEHNRNAAAEALARIKEEKK